MIAAADEGSFSPAGRKLVQIELETHPNVGPGFSMQAIHRKDEPPGPAGRWFIQQLKQ